MNPSTFNLSTALDCARLVAALYPGAAQPKQPNVFSKETDTQALVEPWGEKGTFVVAFPGTASFTDCITDLKIRKREFCAGKVHRGFLAAHESVYQQILAQLPSDCRLTIAGHSLGGALATLLAYDLAEAGFEVSGVYTFGSPRVGNGSFARAYNDRLGHVSYRITNAGDPVPSVPLPLPTFRSGIYTHVEREFYLNRDGGVTVRPWFAHARETLQTLRAEDRAFVSMDHPIRVYIRKLEALQGRTDVVEKIAEGVE